MINQDYSKENFEIPDRQDYFEVKFQYVWAWMLSYTISDIRGFENQKTRALKGILGMQNAAWRYMYHVLHGVLLFLFFF